MLKPLEGLKVVDFTAFAAGPSTSKLLAEFGANDILVEPLTGCNGTRLLRELDFYHGNKRSIAVDLKTDEGKEIMNRLLKEADVFVSNYRTRALEKLGLDYESIKKINPRIIYAVITGWGDKGPMKDVPGYDTTCYWSRTGMLSDMMEKGGPIPTAPSGMGDTGIGITLSLGICAALYRRNLTGEGMKVFTSLFSQGIYINNDALIEGQYGEQYPISRKAPRRAMMNTYQCKDGWVNLISVNFSKDFDNIFRALDREDLLGDPRWQCVEDTMYEKAPELVAIYDEAFSKYTLDEAEERFARYDIACSRLQTTSDLLKDEQAYANNYLFKLHDFYGNEIVQPKSPLFFGNDELNEYKNAPKVGENTREILKEYGYSEQYIEKLVSSNIVNDGGKEK